MHILLTGATGYIGSQLAVHLAGRGDVVTAIVRSASDVAMLKRLGVQLAVYDGTLASLNAAVAQAKPDITIHVASLFLARHRPEDVDALVGSNILFPAQLTEALDLAGFRKLINVGTSWQHFMEDDYNPVNLYAATKQAFCDLLKYYTEARGFSVVTLKLFDTYGPGDHRRKLFTLLRNTARSGDTLKMSPGEQNLDLVYITDVLAAFDAAMAALPRSAGMTEYGVRSGCPIQLKALTDVYARVVGRPLHIVWGGLDYRPREVMQTWQSAPLPPQWQSVVSLETGIRAMEKDPDIGGLLAGTV